MPTDAPERDALTVIAARAIAEARDPSAAEPSEDDYRFGQAAVLAILAAAAHVLGRQVGAPETPAPADQAPG